jgi:hypothetical protein
MTDKARGGVRPGAGRKLGSTSADDPRTEQMAQRYTKPEAAAIETAARAAGENLSDYIRGAVLERGAFRAAARELGVPLDPVAVVTAIRMLKGRRHTLADAGDACKP